MKIYTVSENNILDCAKVSTFALKTGISIPAIVVGEEGRGRRLGVLPVNLPPDKYTEWKNDGKVEINYATLTRTKAGNPKLNVATDDNISDKIICVMRSSIGFRGNNQHTGDRDGWLCGSYKCDSTGEEKQKPPECPACGSNNLAHIFSDFPGQVLTEGTIAQGGAGRMGSGQQIIATIPKDIVFRVGIGGRLYGRPSAYYYKYDGNNLIVATWEDRIISDIF